ncbi:hypothetical protein Taro_026352 [Colocasia esculenta]|uniref:Uncharacterized protein n=1 Tax=Colocasia esculenta TaxID=4460 RepID=A0A843VR08_COLES|nr:hypothetical protein [Colocasia esculenta]
MPPPIAMALLKAVASSPSHLHPPRHRHLIHGRKNSPSPHALRHHGWAPARVAPSLPRNTPVPTGASIYSAAVASRGVRLATNGSGAGAVAKGAAGFSGWLWMGIAPGRAPSAAGERGGSLRLSRKWAGSGPDGGGGGGSDGWVGLAAQQQQQQQGEPPVMGLLRHHQQNGHGERDDGDVGVDGGNGKQPPAPAHQSSKLMTIPTVLTLGRVAAVPLLVIMVFAVAFNGGGSWSFYMDNQWATTATTSIFIAAAVTDWLDGYIARKMRLGTQFGAFLDPVADKLMVAATLVLLCTRPLEVAGFQMPWLLTVPSIAIIGREITMSAVREWAASQDSKVLEAVAVNNLGKWKTATQMTALTILLASRDSRFLKFFS